MYVKEKQESWCRVEVLLFCAHGWLLQTYATDSLSLSKSVINISQVTAKRSRLVIDGEMVYENARVPFNYRTSIGVRGKVSKTCYRLCYQYEMSPCICRPPGGSDSAAPKQHNRRDSVLSCLVDFGFARNFR